MYTHKTQKHIQVKIHPKIFYYSSIYLFSDIGVNVNWTCFCEIQNDSENKVSPSSAVSFA